MSTCNNIPFEPDLQVKWENKKEEKEIIHSVLNEGSMKWLKKFSGNRIK